MRALCAAAALCLAAALPPSTHALAAPRRHHAPPRAVPLPPERPDIESMFTSVRRTRIDGGGGAGRTITGPDGLRARGE